MMVVVVVVRIGGRMAVVAVAGCAGVEASRHRHVCPHEARVKQHHPRRVGHVHAEALRPVGGVGKLAGGSRLRLGLGEWVQTNLGHDVERALRRAVRIRAARTIIFDAADL